MRKEDEFKNPSCLSRFLTFIFSLFVGAIGGAMLLKELPIFLDHDAARLITGFALLGIAFIMMSNSTIKH